MKFRIEEDKCQAIKIGKIINTDLEKLCSNRMWVFTCSAVIDGMEKIFELKYEFEWYSRSAAQSISYLEIRDNYTFSVQANYESDMPDYNKDIYQILQWLLPTKLPEVYAKINANPVPQTIYADGRIVDVSFYQGGIDFDIRDQ